MVKSTAIVSSILAVLLIVPGSAPAQTPYGDHFQVGGATARYPAVGIDEAGDFIVVWQESVDGPSAVWGQRFWASGVPKGIPYQISSFAARYMPRVAMARDGRHVVVWVNGNRNLEARSFNSNGTPASAEIVVSDKRVLNYLNWVPHDVAISDLGAFFVVWYSTESPDPDADGEDILGQHFAFDGTPFGSLLYINSSTADDQSYPRVAMSNDGVKAFVAWQDGYLVSGNNNVRARAYSGSVPVGPDFQVNQTTAGYQRHVAIDMNIDPDNRVVIAWESEVTGGWWGIFSRLYQVNGIPEENERRFDEWPYGFFVNQYEPAVAITSQRDILAVWQSNSSKNGDDDACIDGRAYYFDGTWSDQFQVNTTAPSTPYKAVMDGNARGSFVAAWHEVDGVWTRRFLEVGAIFGDGFETGSASSWSSP